MAVKPISKSSQAGSVEEDLGELLPLVRAVFGALKRGGHVTAHFEEAFERESLGPRHVPPLMTVALEGELSVSRLAEELGLSLSTTSLMVGELSRAGLLERAEDESDRRRTIVRLNDDYREEIEAWMKERMEPFERTLERLSPRARADFIEGWRILREETAGFGGTECKPTG